VGYNRRKTLPLQDTMEENLSNILRVLLVISHIEGKPLLLSHISGKSFPLYPTTEKNLSRCIPQRMKTSSVVSYNG
jgi:hypothetical protein